MSGQRKSKIKKFTKICAGVSAFLAIVSAALYFGIEENPSIFLILGASLVILALFDIIVIIANKNNEYLPKFLSVLVILLNLPLFLVYILILIADISTGSVGAASFLDDDK